MKSANHLAFPVSLSQIAVGYVIQGRDEAIGITPELECEFIESISAKHSTLT